MFAFEGVVVASGESRINGKSPRMGGISGAGGVGGRVVDRNGICESDNFN